MAILSLTECFIDKSLMCFRQMSHKNGVESEKRLRRAIANSNERRRMQSINAGFQLLRTLLPHSEGEKMSKVLHILTRWQMIQSCCIIDAQECILLSVVFSCQVAAINIIRKKKKMLIYFC